MLRRVTKTVKVVTETPDNSRSIFEIVLTGLKLLQKLVQYLLNKVPLS